MVEWFLGVLYQVVAAIGRFLGWVVLDMAANKIWGSIETYFTNDTKLEKNLKRLAGEQWFDELANDFRYSHIIWNNNWVVRYLSEDANVDVLKKDKEEQRKFIEMVKQEHRKFAGISSKESR